MAKTKFKSDFFKLLNNTCYGMSLNREDKQKDIRLISDQIIFSKYVARNNFVGFSILTSKLVSVELKKENISLTRPIYIGATILDISKQHMYSFIYKTLNKMMKYDLMYIDTDGIVIHTKDCLDVYKILLENKQYFDFSSYPESSKLYSLENKKVPGLFQDEMCGIVISEFIALRPKMYSIFCENSKTVTKAKGIKKSNVNKLSHEEYKKVLFDGIKTSCVSYGMRSFNHNVYIVKNTKTALSAFDDKRYWIDLNTSFAYGHYKIRKNAKV